MQPDYKEQRSSTKCSKTVGIIALNWGAVDRAYSEALNKTCLVRLDIKEVISKSQTQELWVVNISVKLRPEVAVKWIEEQLLIFKIWSPTLSWPRLTSPPQRRLKGACTSWPGRTLCRRSGLNPSSPVTGIFFHEPSSVSLRCREMIVSQIFV